MIFEYANDGKGIPEEDLSKIFDPFFTTQRAQGGTGLGLHIRGAIQTSQRIGNGLADTRRKFIR